ncbi:hypothetical protein AXI71_gp41 [Lactococcus phage GE1]|uniref:Uncharacterized protein n=1 Tax=Lactococcus phage GE1 TaxID=1698369 RepID=A0A0N9BAX4_9CAUD|nr:hypothetical protein AXI71_gp41 [Lactococcus phage GE1]ALA06995.1 hypothetical protein [Lactococcus phage GE1]
MATLSQRQKLEAELYDRALTKTIKITKKKYKYEKTEGGRQRVLDSEDITEKVIQGDRAILMALAKKENLIKDWGDEAKKQKYQQEVEADNFSGLKEFM